MKAWNAFLVDLEKKMGSEVVSKWLRPLKIKDFDACNLYLEAENTFQIAWFEQHVRSLAKQTFVNQNAHPIKIHFTTAQKKTRNQAFELPSTPIEIVSDKIDENMQFSNFIQESDGELVVRFLKQLTPGTFNPIFLYGPSGGGKTHLFMAVVQMLLKQGLKVFYVHAETFSEHVVKAIRGSQMQKFREIYRHQDVLIIDDVHYLARKSATQEEFFHTFNTLHTSRKQILLSSHLPPNQLEDIEPRLISRFEWGIVLQLPSLSPEKMEMVLQNKARIHHFPLTPEVVRFLIERFFSSSKAMMRALEALMIRHRSQEPISLSTCEILLEDLLKMETQIQLTPEKILQSTSAYFGIRPNDILGKSQSKECAFPRKLAMFLCRKKLRLPYQTIGKVFGRDHSTVISSIKQMETKRDSDEIETALKEIEKSFS